jgi:BON domain
MRRLLVFTFAAATAVASVGCETATNTTVNKAMNAANSNGNMAVVVNNNSNMAVNTGMNTNKTVMSSNVSRADYDKERAKYEAEKGASTIGQGANDSWIWFKTKTALATVNDLSDSTINVDVANDVITLKGTVKTAAQKTQAETTAKGIEGQKGVKNELKVDAKDSMTNQMVNGNSNTAKAANTNANMKK